MERSKKNRIIIIAIFLLVLCVAIAGVVLASTKEKSSADSNAKASIEQQADNIVMEREQSQSNLDTDSTKEEGNDNESGGKQSDADNSEGEGALITDEEELANREATKGGLKNGKTSGKKASEGSDLSMGKYGAGLQQSADEPAVAEHTNDADDNLETETKAPNNDNKDDYVAPKTDINLSDKIETNSEGDILFPFVSYE